MEDPGALEESDRGPPPSTRRRRVDDPQSKTSCGPDFDRDRQERVSGVGCGKGSKGPPLSREQTRGRCVGLGFREDGGSSRVRVSCSVGTGSRDLRVFEYTSHTCGRGRRTVPVRTTCSLYGSHTRSLVGPSFVLTVPFLDSSHTVVHLGSVGLRCPPRPHS